MAKSTEAIFQEDKAGCVCPQKMEFPRTCNKNKQNKL